MRIANPLYDYAFKYLMSNERAARMVLSVFLDTKILSVELSQQEIIVADEIRNFTLYRLDFKAQIEDENGKSKTVLIELQKSKLPTNILRFRQYLSAAYAQHKKVEKEGKELKEVYPIIAIYILGYNLPDIQEMAVIVDNKVKKFDTKEVLEVEDDFTTLLSHKCVVLQVRRLPPERQTRIEKFMSLFNQAWIAEENYILDLQEIPEEFEDLAIFLKEPLSDTKIVQQLQAEREVEDLFANQEADLKLTKEALKLSKEREEGAKAREEEAKAKLNNMICKLREMGQTDAEIAAFTDLSLEEVKSIIC